MQCRQAAAAIAERDELLTVLPAFVDHIDRIGQCRAVEIVDGAFEAG